MPTSAKPSAATIIPCLRYRDARAAIDWLCRAFGFTKHAVYDGPEGTIAHAQLSFASGMIMLSSETDSEFTKYMTSPRDAGRRETQCPYVVVADADAHYAAAVAAGAEMLIPLRDESYGGRGYSCRDLEGHIWSFGTYGGWPRQRGWPRQLVVGVPQAQEATRSSRPSHRRVSPIRNTLRNSNAIGRVQRPAK